MPPSLRLISEIEARQDEVLRQLDVLNAKLERALAEFGGLKIAKPGSAKPDADPALSESPAPLKRAA